MYISLTATKIGILIAANILVMSLLQPLGGALADKLNRNVLVVTGSIANIAFLALIPSGKSFLDLLGICLLGSLGGSISMPAASAMIVEEGRRFGMGSTMALFGMVFSMGMGIGPLLGGTIVDVLNIGAVFYFGAFMGMLGTAILLFYVGNR
jgi:MFS family permease